MPFEEKRIVSQIAVIATPEEIWSAWTTPEGVKSFFAPECNIELKIYGAYEMFFRPDAEPGQRGGEGCIILAIQPNQMLTFTWNAPPELPEVREQRTVVIVRMVALDDEHTMVWLHHCGWGNGGEWDKANEYFSKAWDVVLYRLKHRFEQGPIDWNDPIRPE
jgi:uncharacterized protein YndB with AHSA1/START domain